MTTKIELLKEKVLEEIRKRTGEVIEITKVDILKVLEPSKNFGFIYIMKNTITDKLYVGQTRQKNAKIRFSRHFRDAKSNIDDNNKLNNWL